MDSEETKDLVKNQFGRAASKYTTSQIHSSQSDLDFVVEFIKPKQNWEVLDIATGTGHLALTLAPNVLSVIASDITSEMLNEAQNAIKRQQVSNIVTEEIDVHKIPYEPNSFDLTASRIAPHHFHDISTAISEMVRVTKPGGYIFIQDTVAPDNEMAAQYFNQIEKLRDPSHIRDLSVNEWIQLLEDLGCTVIKSHTKSKDWPLRWWTERMSTPHGNIAQIIDILERIYDKFAESINIRRSSDYQSGSVEKVIDDWSLHPNNGYFLARKQNL